MSPVAPTPSWQVSNNQTAAPEPQISEEASTYWNGYSQQQWNDAVANNRIAPDWIPEGQKALYDNLPSQGQSYWTPQRVARTYWAVQSMPPGQEAPSWMDSGYLNQAFNYIQSKNLGRPVEDWTLADNDPMAQWLSSQPLPPDIAMRTDEQRKAWAQPGVSFSEQTTYELPQDTASQLFTADELKAMSPTRDGNYIVTDAEVKRRINALSNPRVLNVNDVSYVDSIINQPLSYTGLSVNDVNTADAIINPDQPANKAIYSPSRTRQDVVGKPANIPQEDWDKMNAGQKLAMAGLSDVGNVLNKAVDNPVTQATGTKDLLMGALTMLNIPAQTAEQLLGTTAQAIDVAGQAVQQGPVKGADVVAEFLNNLPAAWEASKLMYEGSFSTTLTPGNIVNLDKHTVVPDQMSGATWAMREARKRIQAGEAPSDVYDDLSSKFGYDGLLRDVVLQSIIDPLNFTGSLNKLVGKGTTKAGEVAEAAGKAQAGKALKLLGNSLAPGEVSERYGSLGKRIADVYMEDTGGDIIKAVQRYGLGIRSMQPEEAAKFDALSRFVAGVDKEGMPKLLQQATKFKDINNVPQLFNWLGGLDAKSRATEALHQSADSLQLAADYVDNDPEKFVALIEQIGKKTPEQAVAEIADNVPTVKGKGGEIAAEIPSYFSSVDAQTLPLAYRDALPNLRNLRDAWVMSKPATVMVNRIAEAFGKTADELVKLFQDTKASEVDKLYKNLLDDLTKRAGMNEEAARMADMMGKDAFKEMNGQILKKWASDLYGKGVPLTKDQFIGEAYRMLQDNAGKWAAKYYGITADSSINRIMNITKKVQGPLLLSTPQYALRNGVSNFMHLSYDGLLGFDSIFKGNQEKFLSEFGIVPERIADGLNPGDIGTLASDGKEGMRHIIKATEDGGKLQKVSESLSGVNNLNVFGRLSNTFESMSSKAAFVKGMREFLIPNWKKGVGFDDMPATLRASLDRVSPGLADKLTASIERTYNGEKISGVLDDLNSVGLQNVMSKQDAGLMQHFPDLYDALDTQVKAARSPAELRKAFAEARQNLREAISKELKDQTQAISENALNKSRIEGPQGALDTFDEIMQTRHDHWNAHLDEMNRVADAAAEVTGKDATKVWKKGFEDAKLSWDNFRVVENAKLEGIIKGLGADTPEYKFFTDNIQEVSDNWQYFFNKRIELMNEYEDAVRALESQNLDEGILKAEKARLWDIRQKSLNDEYITATLEEDRLQGVMDNAFAQLYGRQFSNVGKGAEQQAIASAAKWRYAIGNTRRQMVEAEMMYRFGEVPADVMNVFGDLLPDNVKQGIRRLNNGSPLEYLRLQERRAAAKVYNGEIKRLLIKEMLDASNGNAPDVPSISTRPVEITPQERIREIARNTDASVTADRHVMNIVNKAVDAEGNKLYDIKSFTDITPEMAQEAFRQHIERHPELTSAKRLPITGEPAPAVGAPLGTADGMTELPKAETLYEGYVNHLSPMIDRLEGQTIERLAKNGMGTISAKDLPPEVVAQVQSYLGHVRTQLADVKMGALRWGENRRDFALLNYAKRTGFDNMLSFMPYQYWYTRSALNWAARSLTRPAILANMARWNNFLQKTTSDPGFPTRLKGKVKISVPWLPKWMGDSVYIDPLQQIFPPLQLTRPFQNLAEQQNLETRKTESAVMRMLEDEQITEAQANDAIRNHWGDVWDKANAQVNDELDKEIQNPVDFAFSLSGPSLPVSIAYNLAMGRPERIGLLPVSSMIQAGTAVLGIGGPRGINIEAGVRKAAGIPQQDRYEDYRMDAMLSWMNAEGLVNEDEAVQAMIDRQGSAFTEAQKRVSIVQFGKFVGSAIGVDFYPEGEKKQRALQQEYYDILDKSGKSAANSFRNSNKETQSFYYKNMSDKPQERLHSYLIDELWDRYKALPDVQKQVVRDSLGTKFTDGFINKETRNYDALDNQTLALWSKMMNGYAPKDLEQAYIPLKWAPEDVASKVQTFKDNTDKRYPGLDQIQKVYYSLPEEARAQFAQQYPQINQYQADKNKFLAENPDAIPYMTGKNNDLYGVSPDVQELVYKYRNQIDTNYPGAYDMQTAYYSIPESDKEKRSQFLKDNPELEGYWKFKREYSSKYPKAAAYILDEKTLSGAIITDAQRFYDIFKQEYDRLYPDINQTWNEYYAIQNKQQRSAFYKAHPELKESQNLKSAWASMYPDAAPYILSDSRLSGMIMPRAQAEQIFSQMSGEAGRSLLNYAYNNGAAGNGFVQEMRRIWNENGQPGGDFDTFMEQLKEAAISYNSK